MRHIFKLLIVLSLLSPAFVRACSCINIPDDGTRPPVMLNHHMSTESPTLLIWGSRATQEHWMSHGFTRRNYSVILRNYGGQVIRAKSEQHEDKEIQGLTRILLTADFSKAQGFEVYVERTGDPPKNNAFGWTRSNWMGSVRIGSINSILLPKQIAPIVTGEISLDYVWNGKAEGTACQVPGPYVIARMPWLKADGSYFLWVSARSGEPKVNDYPFRVGTTQVSYLPGITQLIIGRSELCEQAWPWQYEKPTNTFSIRLIDEFGRTGPPIPIVVDLRKLIEVSKGRFLSLRAYP